MFSAPKSDLHNSVRRGWLSLPGLIYLPCLVHETVYNKYVNFSLITETTLHADLTGALPIVADG